MKDENQGKLLLELALHRYDEEVVRNEAIDNKNKSMVAFLAVMLTIQCTVLIRLIELNTGISSNGMRLLFSLFIISFFSIHLRYYFSFQHSHTWINSMWNLLLNLMMIKKEFLKELSLSSPYSFNCFFLIIF